MPLPIDPLPVSEQYAYLFEDIDIALAINYEKDKALVELERSIVERQNRVAEFSQQAKAAREECHNMRMEIADLQGRLKALDSQYRIKSGVVTQLVARETVLEAQIRDAQARVKKRKQWLDRREMERRLKTIGKKLVQNLGNRVAKTGKGGGFDIIDVDET